MSQLVGYCQSHWYEREVVSVMAYLESTVTVVWTEPRRCNWEVLRLITGIDQPPPREDIWATSLASMIVGAAVACQGRRTDDNSANPK